MEWRVLYFVLYLLTNLFISELCFDFLPTSGLENLLLDLPKIKSWVMGWRVMYLLTKRRWKDSWTVYTCDKLVGSFFLSETFIFQQCCRKSKCECRNNCTWGSWFLFQDQVSMKTIKPLRIIKNKQKCMPKTLILARREESLNYLLPTLFKSPDPDSPLGRQVFIIEIFNPGQ